MAVRLRLRRIGRKKRPFYRIVAADQRSPRNGGFLEILGIYDPLLTPHRIEVNEERITYWLDRGAQPSDTVRSLLKQKGIIYKRELVRKGEEPEKIVEEMRKWEVLQIEKGKRREAAKLKTKKIKAEKTEPETEEKVIPPRSETEKSEAIEKTEAKEKVETAEKQQETEKPEETENS